MKYHCDIIEKIPIITYISVPFNSAENRFALLYSDIKVINSSWYFMMILFKYNTRHIFQVVGKFIIKNKCPHEEENA